MNKIEMNFNTSFKFKMKNSKVIYTCHKKALNGDCTITWSESGTYSTNFCASTKVTEHLSKGNWFVLPTEYSFCSKSQDVSPHLNKIEMNFNTSFKFKTEDSDFVYTCHKVDSNGECTVTWSVGGIDYLTDTYPSSKVTEFLNKGKWIVLPSEYNLFHKEAVTTCEEYV